jgi:hypothetical protein
VAEGDHVPALAQGVDPFACDAAGWLLAAAGKSPSSAQSKANRMADIGSS